MLTYQTSKISQGGPLLIHAGNAVKRLVSAYLKVLFPEFPILCFGFDGCRSLSPIFLVKNSSDILESNYITT